MGRLYIDSGATVIREFVDDMQNILGFAARGDIAAMQRVFADQSSMVRGTCNGAVLTAMPVTSVSPLTIASAPQVDGLLHTPFMLVGLILASGMIVPTGDLDGSLAGTQALMYGRWDAAVWLLQQPGGARLEFFTENGTS